MLHSIIDFFMNTFGNMSYFSIIILMTLESSIFPVPSELVVPPAAYLASSGQLNIFLVIACSVLGSLMGALFNYFLAFFLGRPILYKFVNSKIGKIFLLSEKRLQKAEEYFKKNGEISTFIGRLIPGVRHLISLPAGLAKMKIKNFLFFTFIGSLIWTSILAILGYLFGANKNLLTKYYEEIKIILLIIGPILLAMFLILKYRKKRKKLLQN
jgi:membrane protein DedA with SNARE-associated domain